MRKYFEGLSVIGGVLVLVSIFFGSFLRLNDLNLISHWSDELATLYYSKFLNLVFFEETHPPGFYILTKILFFFVSDSIFNLRLFVAGLSVFLNLYISYYAKRSFSLYGWVIFVVLLFLIPVDVAYARIGRMYSLLFSLSLLFYLFCLEKPQKMIKISVLSFIISWIFPVGFLPGLGYVCFVLLKDKKFSRDLLFPIASIVPIFLYYLGKFFFLSRNGFLTDYLGGANKVRNLFLDFFYTMGGDHIPKFSIEPLWAHAWIFFAVFSIGVLIISFYHSKKLSLWYLDLNFHLFLIVFTILFVSLFSLSLINIKLGRYLVFLIPIFCVHSTVLGTWEHKKYHLIALSLLGLLLVYHLTIFVPFKIIPWERETFGVFNSFRQKTNKPDNFIFCGNRYQYYFYFKTPHRHCMQDYEKFKEKKEDFVFFDMNGFMSESIFVIAKDYQILHLERFGMSTLAFAKYRTVKE